MRKLLSLLLTFAVFCGLMTAVPSEAATIKLNKSSLNMTAGNTFQLKVKGTSSKVKWSSSKKSVATVSKKGKVKAVKSGSATITAKVAGKKLRCKVKVKALVTGKGTKASPYSAYNINTFNYYEEGKKKGKFSLQLLRFVSGDAAAELARSNTANAIPEKNQEYIYFKFKISYISGNQTIRARDIFDYYHNIYGDNSKKVMKNLDWGFFFEPVDDLGILDLSPGNKVVCGKAVLVEKGHSPITFCIQTGKTSFTWFTTAK